MEYTYDDAGNLIQTVDNKRQIIKYSYDGANRMLTEDYLDDGMIRPDVKYFYDTPTEDYPYATNTKGKFVLVEDLSGSRFLSYDPRGNVKWSAKRIKELGLSYDFIFLAEFDSMDRMISQTFPDGDRISYNYNPARCWNRFRGSSTPSITTPQAK